MIDLKLLKQYPDLVFQNLINRHCLGIDDTEQRELAELIIATDIFLLRSKMSELRWLDHVIAGLSPEAKQIQDMIKTASKEDRPALVEKAKAYKEALTYFKDSAEETRKWLENEVMKLPNLTLNEYEYLKRVGWFDKEKSEEKSEEKVEE